MNSLDEAPHTDWYVGMVIIPSWTTLGAALP